MRYTLTGYQIGFRTPYVVTHNLTLKEIMADIRVLEHVDKWEITKAKDWNEVIQDLSRR